MTALRVAEVFGPTIQGEGPHTGCQAAFLRLSGCNLTCDFCDTPYTWDWTRFDESAEMTLREPDELAEQLNAFRVERVILTGGEPMIQQNHLPMLLEQVVAPVDVETNGTIAPTAHMEELVDLFVVSPKIGPSSRQQTKDVVQRPYAMSLFVSLAQHDQAAFKYVARDRADLDAIARHVERFGIPGPWIMPEGRTAAEVVDTTRAIADTVVARGWRLTTRLHVLAWGDQRGR